MMQFSLISLIPGLLQNLDDCADPDFDHYEKNLIQPTSLKTSERGSCRSWARFDEKSLIFEVLSYMGLPLQL